jgi:hypothetical protein
LIAIAAAALLLAACGSGGGGETIEAGTPPSKMLDSANLDGVSSGAVEGVFEILNSDQRNSLVVHLASGFDSSGHGVPPSFFVSIGSTGQNGSRPFEFNGRLFYSPNGATLVYGPAFKELTYAVRGSEFKKLESKLEAAQEEGGVADISACSGAAEGASLESLVRSPEYEGTAKEPIRGTRLFQVSGELRVAALMDQLVRIAEDPNCGAQMEAVGLPSAVELKAIGEELDRHVEDGHVLVEIDKHGMLRSFEAILKSASSKTGKTELKFGFSLKEVNEEVEIPAGAPGKPLAALLGKFGVKPTAVLQASGEELLLGLLEGFGGGATGRLP